jgi:hypothetical protein
VGDEPPEAADDERGADEADQAEMRLDFRDGVPEQQGNEDIHAGHVAVLVVNGGGDRCGRICPGHAGDEPQRGEGERDDREEAEHDLQTDFHGGYPLLK